MPANSMIAMTEIRPESGPAATSAGLPLVDEEGLMIPQHEQAVLEVIEPDAEFLPEPFRQKPLGVVRAGVDPQGSAAPETWIHFDNPKASVGREDELDRDGPDATGQRLGDPHAG